MKSIRARFVPDVEAGSVTWVVEVKYYNELYYKLIEEFKGMLDDLFEAWFNRVSVGQIGSHKIYNPAQALYMVDREAYDSEFEAWCKSEIECLISNLNNGDEYTIGSNEYGEPTPITLWEEIEG